MWFSIQVKHCLLCHDHNPNCSHIYCHENPLWSYGRGQKRISHFAAHPSSSTWSTSSNYVWFQYSVALDCLPVSTYSFSRAFTYCNPIHLERNLENCTPYFRLGAVGSDLLNVKFSCGKIWTTSPNTLFHILWHGKSFSYAFLLYWKMPSSLSI